MINASKFWSFDVSALMILIGETEEATYRAAERSIWECLTPIPIAGLQCYLRSYKWLLETSNFQYYSPYGCKSAPLRNQRLANALRTEKLLEDGKITVYRIPATSNRRNGGSWNFLLLTWFVLSWILFIVVLLLLFWTLRATWIGQANCICLCSWSVMLRLIEFHCVRPRPYKSQITKPTDPDAIFVFGRRDSCFVLEGSRSEIKEWTACGLYFICTSKHEGALDQLLTTFWKGFSQLGSLALLLLIFTSIPNGSTMDQVFFIMVNLLGQLNVVLGQKLNGKCLFHYLERIEALSAKSRTDVNAFLIRRFSAQGVNTDWTCAANLLPETEVWRRWKQRIIEDKQKDSKELYDSILDEIMKENHLGCKEPGDGDRTRADSFAQTD